MQEGLEKARLFDAVESLKALMPNVADLAEEDFDRFIEAWHDLVDRLKGAVFDPGNRLSRPDYEHGWGAQSIQFVIDCIPEFHRVLLQNYKRGDSLKLLDVGAGCAAGSNVFALLHSSRYVYSLIQVDAVDHIPIRRRWAKTLYPMVNYTVSDLYDLPDRSWDIVFCSHVVEHVSDPKGFCGQLARVCKGFAFVYAPYKEVKNRIPSHVNVITEKLFKGFELESLKIMRSMGWHPGIPEDRCILAVLDCRMR